MGFINDEIVSKKGEFHCPPDEEYYIYRSFENNIMDKIFYIMYIYSAIIM